MGNDNQNNNDQNNNDQNNEKHTQFEIALTAIAIVYNLLVLLFAMIWVFSPYIGTWSWLTKIEIEPKSDTHILIALFACGAIGGASYCLKSIYERLSDAYTPNPAYTPPSLIGKPPRVVFNIEIWFFWFLYRPVQSGVLAMVIVALINMGLFSFGGKDSSENLNSIFFQLGLGFLVGYGTHEVLKKIEEIISVLFARKGSDSPSATVPKPEEGNDQPVDPATQPNQPNPGEQPPPENQPNPGEQPPPENQPNPGGQPPPENENPNN